MSKKSELISQSLDKSLTRPERFQLKLHLLICRYCARFNKQMQAMKTSIDKLRKTVEDDQSVVLSDEIKKRIVGKVNKK